MIQFLLIQNNSYLIYNAQQQRRSSREESLSGFALRDSGLTEEVSELSLHKSVPIWKLSLSRFALFGS